MNRRTKIGAAVAGAVVLAVAVGAAGAVAAQRALDARDESQAVIDDAAGQLGVEPSQLTDALKEALKNRVDEAVESGRLTEEQGAEMKERIESGETPLVTPGFGRQGGPGQGGGPGHFGFRHLGHAGKLDAAAEYLGLTEDELRERLRDGDTLAEIAKAEGKPVDGLVDALVADATKRIDEAVENGRLTEEQATELKEGLEARTQDRVEGELRARPFGGFRHGFGGPGPFSDRSRSGPKA